MAKKKQKNQTTSPTPAPAAAPAWRSRIPAWLPLAALLLLGAVMRFNMVLWEPLIFPDSLQYMHLAKEIRSGEFFAGDYDLDRGFIKSRRLPPLYSTLLAPFADTDADIETVGHLVSILLSLYSFIPLYFITATIFSRREAAIAGLFFALHSLTNKFATPILTESTFTAVYLSVIWLALSGMRRKSWPRMLAAGALSALAYLTRDVGISAFAVAAAGAVCWHKLVERGTWRQAAAPAAAVVVGFLLVASPYFVNIRARTGHWGLTVQMSNTSITEQMQLFGGDRFDRDRISVREKRERLVGGAPAGGPLGLLRVAPSLVLKVARNAYGYVRELMTKAQSLPLVLLLLGLAAAAADFRRGRDRRRLFEQLWPALWAAQLLLLYALITPYMVDIRYMYPLLPLVFMLGSRGITFAEDEVKSAPPAWAAGLAAALFAAYILAFPQWVDPEAYAKLEMMIGREWGPIRLLLAPLAVSIVFGVILLWLLPALKAVSDWSARTRLLTGAIVFGSGMFLLVVLAFARHRLASAAPAALLAGPGVALILSGLMDGGRRPRLPGIALVFGTLLFFAPDTIYQWNWFSNRELAGKYASGYKEAAAEIKAAKLIPPGRLICSRKPFIAYYLDGYWYLDEEQQPIPKRDERLMELIAERKIDYLALDTFTMKNLRPALLERSLAIEPIPGAALVYGRYFPRYNRIITIYDCHRADPGVPPRATANEYLAAAQQFYSTNQLPFAMRELEQCLKLDPKNTQAWHLTLRILTTYYDCGSRGDAPSLALMPRILPAIVQASKNLYQLNPRDPEARASYQHAEQILAEEKVELQQMRPVGSGATND